MKVIRADAPGYDARLPASTDHALGVRVEGDQLMQTNVCFGGDIADGSYTSWTNRTLQYDAGGGGDLKADFDKVISVDVGSVYRFNGLFDCTGNGVPEACDIANGLPDSDLDGIPDVCEP